MNDNPEFIILEPDLRRIVEVGLIYEWGPVMWPLHPDWKILGAERNWTNAQP